MLKITLSVLYGIVETHAGGDAYDGEHEKPRREIYVVCTADM